MKKTKELVFLNKILITDEGLIDFLHDSDFKDTKNLLIFQCIKELRSENKEILTDGILQKIMEKNNIKFGDTWPDNLPNAMYLFQILILNK
jgi:hypothetical protein